MRTPARFIQTWTACTTADPRKVPGARKLKEITYDEMLDLATLGAGVLHNRSVELAKKYGVPLVVRSSLNNNEGTVVKEEVTVERMLISGVALDTDAVRIAVLGLKDVPGMAFKLFDVLARKHINVDVILQSIGRAGTKDISFTVDKKDLDEAVAVLEDNQARLGYKEASFRAEHRQALHRGSGNDEQSGRRRPDVREPL